MEEYQKSRSPNDFIKYLTDLSKADDRAALADLRCGFSKARETRAWSRIGAFCRLDSEDRIVFQTVGAGYATNPVTDETPYANFGDVARKLFKENELTTFDSTFRRILACKSKQDVCQYLRGPILASKAKDVPIPWKSLLWDLLRWEIDSETIKERWAARYWQVQKETEGSDASNAGESD